MATKWVVYSVCLAFVAAALPIPEVHAASVVGWGLNDRGQLNTPAGSNYVAIASGGYHGLALTTDGTIMAWGNDSSGQVSSTPGGNGFRSIAAGEWHSLAIRADGSIVAWGDNSWGQATPPSGNNFVAVSGGTRWSLALRSDGSLVAWGDDEYGQRSELPTGNDFKAIAAGQWHGLALKNDGSLVSWGSDESRQKSDTPVGSGFKAIATCLRTSYALRTDGSIEAWGRDAYGQVTNKPTGGGFTAIASQHETGVALAADGSIVCWGCSDDGRANPPEGNQFTAIAAGGATGFALQTGVRVYLEDDLGLPLDGQSIKVQPAYGGSWGSVFEGVTEGDGGFRCEMTPGYTKIRMTFNQASVEQTVAELAASGYTWTAVAATVKVIDHQGQGIAGVKVSQGGSVWVDHGYTDSAGELGLHLFPNKSYKFKVSGSAVSNSSQIAWFPVPGPIQFQTGYVVSAGTAIRGSIGGAWVPYASPGMHILPGTYSFVFSSPTPSPQSVVVTAGVQTGIP